MIYFYHIGGTGGRSVIKSFLDYAGDAMLFQVFFHEDGNIVKRGKRFHRSPQPREDAFFACSHAPYYACEIPPNTFRFTLMRDPITRFAGRYRQHHMALRMGTTTNWVGNNILESAQQMPRSVVLRQLAMFSKGFNVEEALSKLQGLNVVGRCETMAKSLETLSMQLQLEFPLQEFTEREHPVFRGNPKIIARSRRCVQSEVREHYAALQEIFEPEYRLMEALFTKS